jgi:hypothetical protein
MPELLRQRVLELAATQWSGPWMRPPPWLRALPLRVSIRVSPRMSVRLPALAPARVSPRAWPLACVLSLAALPALVHAADPLPASVRACAAVPDVLQRLSCYDREVARYPAPQAKSSAATGAPAATSPTGASSPQAAATVAPPATSGANTATARVPTSSANAGSGTSAAASGADATAGTAAKDSTQHVVAHLVSIERLPSEMILHLDNGQVWQEVQSVSGDLSLKEGDAVTIDRHFGSYWLSGPHVSSMKVRQKS